MKRLGKYIVVCGDVRKILSPLEFSFAAFSFTPTIIITDPPYPELEKHRAVGTTTRLTKKWFKTLSWDELGEIFELLYKISHKNTHLYVWGNSQSIFNAKPMIERAGWKFWNIIVWNKKRIGMGYHYRNTVEFVLFFEKGKKKLRNLNTTNYFEEKIDNSFLNLHPTFKPISMQMQLIWNSCQKKEVVFDPFMGAGSTLIATYFVNKKFGADISYIGVEIEEEYCKAAINLAKKYGIDVEYLKLE